jgi:hypothetical protein
MLAMNSRQKKRGPPLDEAVFRNSVSVYIEWIQSFGGMSI